MVCSFYHLEFEVVWSVETLVRKALLRSILVVIEFLGLSVAPQTILNFVSMFVH